MTDPGCPFCEVEAPAHEAPLAVALRDRYPVSPGHTLVVPRRHVATWDDATPAEKAALVELADEVMERLRAEAAPDGFNLGVNIGRAAGQTVFHLHLHVIPRFAGDLDRPEGGVRGVIPDKRLYR